MAEAPKWLIRFVARATSIPKSKIIQIPNERNWTSISFSYHQPMIHALSLSPPSLNQCELWMHHPMVINRMGHEIMMTKLRRQNNRDNYLDPSRGTNRTEHKNKKIKIKNMNPKKIGIEIDMNAKRWMNEMIRLETSYTLHTSTTHI